MTGFRLEHGIERWWSHDALTSALGAVSIGVSSQRRPWLLSIDHDQAAAGLRRPAESTAAHQLSFRLPI
jgi:hypothetical protein